MPLILKPHEIGEGWRELPVGARITTFAQYYSFHPLKRGWICSPFFTRDGYVVRETNNYRVPVSLRARWRAFWAAVPKLVKRPFQKNIHKA